jgi:hypothetical protein
MVINYSATLHIRAIKLGIFPTELTKFRRILQNFIKGLAENKMKPPILSENSEPIILNFG